MKILVTGAAGFIGMHLCRRLADMQHDVTGIDNINAYYDTGLKYGRLSTLGIPKDKIIYNTGIKGVDNFRFIELDITDAGNLMALFAHEKFDVVIHLAAQAGVRYSITNPRDYIDANVIGFFNIIESCRSFPVKHFIFASSSSVYGNSSDIPFNTNQRTDSPVSLYAATKKSNELLGYNYAHLFGIPTTGLRFFTVYGPWGRPDMAYFSFTKNIFEEKPIQLFNGGNLKRDFTFIDDIIESIARLITLPPVSEPPFAVYNIGNSQPVEVKQFVQLLEEIIGKKANIEFKPMQDGDVTITFAETSALEALTGFSPATPIETGLRKSVNWFKEYYGINAS